MLRGFALATRGKTTRCSGMNHQHSNRHCKRRLVFQRITCGRLGSYQILKNMDTTTTNLVQLLHHFSKNSSTWTCVYHGTEYACVMIIFFIVDHLGQWIGFSERPNESRWSCSAESVSDRVSLVRGPCWLYFLMRKKCIWVWLNKIYLSKFVKYDVSKKRTQQHVCCILLEWMD